MTAAQKRYSETFKREVLTRVEADPSDLVAIARELDVPSSTIHSWRRRAAAKEAAARATAEEPSLTEPDLALLDGRLRQLMVDATYALALAIRDSTGSAPLNQLATAFGLMIDRLLRLDALAVLAAQAPAPGDEQVIRIEYLDPDGSVHKSPPWARGDPAFEAPIVPGQVRSPFWDFPDHETEDADDDPDDESEWD